MFKAIVLSLLVFSAVFAWANHTQVAIYSQDIPPNLVCIKDTFPDAYTCVVNDQLVPWYISTEGLVAQNK